MDPPGRRSNSLTMNENDPPIEPSYGTNTTPQHIVQHGQCPHCPEWKEEH